MKKDFRIEINNLILKIFIYKAFTFKSLVFSSVKSFYAPQMHQHL